MGSSKKVTVSYWYKLIMHLGWCKGPIDALLEIRGGDRTAWKGHQTTSGDIYINKPDLYGGESAEGGIQGTFEVMMGEPDQMPSAYMASEFGDAQPGYRGRATVLLKGPKIGAGNPYPKPLFFKLERFFKGWDDNVVWYPEKVKIGLKPAASLAVYFAIDLSGSMDTITGNGQSRLTNMKTALNAALDSIRDTVVSAGGSADIMLSGFGEHPDVRESIFFRRASTANVNALKAWVSSRTARMTETDFTPGLMDAPAFFSGAPSFSTKICFFITDGIPGLSDASMTPMQIAEASRAIVDSLGGVPTYGINIDLTDTTYTAVVDNTPSDDVPVVAGGDPSALTSVLTGAMAGLFGMNPAHIIYDSITSRRENGGMEEPAVRVNDASFRAAADKLYAEGFGLCCTWHGGESAEQFQQRICNVIGGSVTQSRLDGQYYLDLLRDVANPLLLPTITDDDILDWEDEPAVPSESINQIQVKWFDPETREERITTPVQALGAIEEAGGLIADIREYYEIPVESLALRVAQRDLQSVATALRKFTFSCTRKAFDLRPGMQVRLLCPKRGFADVIAVIGDIDYGDFANDDISIVALQDVFSLPESAFVDPQEGLGPPSSTDPVNITDQTAVETPYVELVTTLSSADLNALTDESGYLMVGARRPANGTNYRLATRTAGEDYEEYGNGDWTPAASIVEGDPLEDAAPNTDFTLSDARMLDQVVLGTWALWGSEMCRVDALDVSGLTLTLGRAVGDSVPQKHEPGEVIYFIGDWYSTDSREYVDGEIVNAKLMNRTGSGQVPLEAAAELTVEMDGRQARPYPPSNVTLNGEYYPTSVIGDVELAWGERDRVLQADQLISWVDGSVGGEPGQTYSVITVDRSDMSTRYSEDNIVSPYALSPINIPHEARVELFSKRDGLDSYQRVTLDFLYGFDMGGVIGALRNETYQASVVASGAAEPCTWSLSGGALPAGLSLGVTSSSVLPVEGIVSAANGYYTFEITCEDANGIVSSKEFTIGVGTVVTARPFDGPNGSSVYPLLDRAGRSWVQSGAVTNVDNVDAIGGSEANFNGGFLRCDYNADLADFVTQDFTVEFFFRSAGDAGAGRGLVKKGSQNSGGSALSSWLVAHSNLDQRLLFRLSDTGLDGTTAYPEVRSPAITPGVRHHYQASRRGNRIYCHLDGVLSETLDIPPGFTIYNSTSSAAGLVIGSFNSSGNYLGRMDELRIQVGAVRYEEKNFDPPTWACDFPAVKTGTLLHFDGADGATTFTDEVGFSWVRGGSAQISTTQSKFGGSSLRLNGSTDYIQPASGQSRTFLAQQVNMLDFTVELWAYMTSSKTVVFFDERDGTTSAQPALLLFTDTAAPLRPLLHVNGVNVISAASDVLSLNAWHHLAVCRKNGVTRLFVNGTQAGSNYTDSTQYRATNCRIGRTTAASGDARNLVGYIDEFRKMKGVGLYDANFVPPAAPFVYPE